MMGLFSGLLGNASQKDIEKTERELENILTPAENVELAFSLIRDLIVFQFFQYLSERHCPINR